MLKRALQRIWSTLRLLISHWNEDECSWRSAAVAFYGAFSLFPLCLMIMSVLGYVARYSETVQSGQVNLVELVEDSTSPWVATQLSAVMSQIKTDAGVGGPVGFGVLIVAAIGIFLQLDATLDRIWHGPAKPSASFWHAVRGVLVDRLVAFVLLLGVGVVLAMVVVANLSLASVEKFVAQWTGALWVWRALQRLLTPVIYTLVFTAIYKIMPKARVRWLHAFEGAMLSALAWWLGQLGLQWVLVGDHYNAYGVVGSFMGILVWLYYSSASLFLGAELVRLQGTREAEKQGASN